MAKRKATGRKGSTRKTSGRKTSGRKTTRKAAKRQLIDPKRGGKRFVRRSRSGKFNESDQVSRSLARDQKTSAKRKTRSGQGDKGDRKK